MNRGSGLGARASGASWASGVPPNQRLPGTPEPLTPSPEPLVRTPSPQPPAPMNDLPFALPTLRKSPGFTAAAILTLALAIGSNTAIFSVVNGVLLRPLPFAEPDRLFMLGEQSRQGGFRPPSYPTFLDWQAQSSALVDLAYVRGGGQRLAGPEGVQSVIVSVVSPAFFATLGERPLMGRLFTPDEERAGAHVAVLSYGLWQGRFG